MPVSNPVYEFLIHAELRGMLPHFSSSDLPLSKMEIVSALEKLRDKESELSSQQKSLLDKFEREFGIVLSDRAVVFYSPSDSIQVLSSRMLSDSEKSIYHFSDSNNNVSIDPLASFEYYMVDDKSDNNGNVTMGNLGVRVYGTLGGRVGYFLQATNGSVFGGNRETALQDAYLRKNIKFASLASDFDFTESHIRFQYDWFYGGIGRETRLMGSGLSQRLFLSDNAVPFDALFLGAEFKNFEYKFIHGSLVGQPVSSQNVGFTTVIPEKYIAIHRFALKPEWGEIAFWENIVYSDRNPDLAYLNPLSFYKSLEHALRDRDNSIMGGDITVRPLKGLQIKGSYLLDDIIFSKIGTGYWSNKSAWNIGAQYAVLPDIDFGYEYARVEPYTFSHFNSQNNMTNDSLLYGSYLLPNSDRHLIKIDWFYGQRYPLTLTIGYTRHGNNIYSGDSLIYNAGGDPGQTRRGALPGTGFDGDPLTIEFLTGDLIETLSIEIEAGYEIVRGFNIHAYYAFIRQNEENGHKAKLTLRYNDF